MNMDNPTLRYFDAEMRYLREAGKEFAQAFPEQAAQLNLDKPGPADPYVERLFEGFAFLMGRLREKLDDDLPELTEGLVSMLWPHYLRTIPSLAIVELAPDLSKIKRNVTLAKGFEVQTQPIGPQQVRCRYTTTQDLALRALVVQSFGVAYELDGRALLRLRLAPGPEATWADIDLEEIPLYLNADPLLASALQKAMTLHVGGVYLRLPDIPGRQVLDGRFKCKGFADADRLWPKGTSAFSGYQLLLEYFTFREKFLFVTLTGLERMSVPADAAWLEVEVVLGDAWPQELQPRAEHLCLHAVPVINLFPLEADPLQLDLLQSDYLIRPKRLQHGYTEIYSVDRVSRLDQSERVDYVPFSSFQHKGGMLREESPERYFHTRLKRGPNGLHDTWLILGGEGFAGDRVGTREGLSLTLTGTNGQLPRKGLQSTRIDTAVHSNDPPLTIRNLCEPTLPCYPPDRDRFHWRILSHLGSNFLPMLDNAEVLRGTLALYDWNASEMNRRRLMAITEVEHFLIERFERGFLLRGVDIVVTLDASGFMGEGDIMLFGEMLNRFFALYADIHLFNQVTLIVTPTGKHLRWKENHSERVPG
jgi:type VI secretion system protein ImpG